MGGIIKTISILGTGWLGLPLAEHFVANGYLVNGSTRSPERFDILTKANITPFFLDLERLTDKDKGFFEADILVINIPFKGVGEFAKLVTVIETSNIDKVIFVSSTSVYRNDAGEINEEDETALSPCKLLDIESLFTANQHFTTTIVRFGGLIGYNRNPAHFFKNGKVINKPESKVNLIHRDDCINILDRIIGLNAWGKTYNGCADTHPTKKEFYTYACQMSKLPIPNCADDNDPSYKVILNTKVKQELNYRFVHTDVLKLQFI